MMLNKLNYYLVSMLTMITLASNYVLGKANDFKNQVVKSVQTRELQFNGWFLVLIAVILALGATIYLGLMVWCVTYGHGSFTGAWKYARKGYVYAKCAK